MRGICITSIWRTTGLIGVSRACSRDGCFTACARWDRQTASNVDLFVGISHHVRQRIWRTYRRPAKVIYPPVRVDHFTPQGQKDDFYVTVSRLVSYKRVDLIVAAFAAMPTRKLVVIGDGPELAAPRRTARRM